MFTFINNQRSKQQDTTLTYQTYKGSFYFFNATYTKSGRGALGG